MNPFLLCSNTMTTFSFLRPPEIDGCRIDSDQDFLVLWSRFCDLLELKNIRRSVFCIHNCFHIMEHLGDVIMSTNRSLIERFKQY